MYCKYRIVESIASSVSQYESYRDQVYRYTPNNERIKLGTLYYEKYSYQVAICGFTLLIIIWWSVILQGWPEIPQIYQLHDHWWCWSQART